MKYDRFKWETCGKALTENTVVSGNARFTVLTDRLIRIEYDTDRKFTDNASQIVFYRNFPKQNFEKSIQNGGFVTTEMSLKWGKTATFKLDGAKGDTSLIPERRNWKICFRGFSQKLNTCVTVSGEETLVDFKFDEKTNTTKILIKDVAVVDEIIITVSPNETLFADNSFAKMRIYDILVHAQMSYAVKSSLWDAVCRKDKYLYSSCSQECYSKVRSSVEEMYSLLNQ